MFNVIFPKQRHVLDSSKISKCIHRVSPSVSESQSEGLTLELWNMNELSDLAGVLQKMLTLLGKNKTTITIIESNLRQNILFDCTKELAQNHLLS